MSLSPRTTLLLLLAAVACSRQPAGEGPRPLELAPLAELEQALGDQAPVELTADVTALDETERQVLDRLFAACRPLDEVYLRQVDRRNPEFAAALDRVPGREGRVARVLFRRQAGLYRRQRGGRAFAPGAPPRPTGGGFYPVDLDREQWNEFLSANPDREAELISLTTIVERDGRALTGVPFSRAFAEPLRRSAEELGRAARLTGDEKLRRLLRAQAEALLDDRYRPAEAAWLEIEGPLTMTLGPLTVEDDRLFGLKAGLEARVAIVDADATALAGRLAAAAGVEPDSAPRVENLLLACGQARAGLPAASLDLPADEMLRTLRGARRVLYGNVLDARFSRVLVPLAERLLDEDQAHLVDGEALRLLAVEHLLAHPPPADRGHPAAAERLLELAPAAEELRADLVGLERAVDASKGGAARVPAASLLVTAVADLLRSVRARPDSPRGRSASALLDRLLADGLLAELPSGRLRIDLPGLAAALDPLADEARALLEGGAPGALLGGLGEPTRPGLPGRLGRLAEGVPLGLAPTFPLAGEEPEPGSIGD